MNNKSKLINYRYYLFLVLIYKGEIDNAKELLCNIEKDIKDMVTLNLIEVNGNNIILTKKALEIIESKNGRDRTKRPIKKRLIVDKKFVDDFIRGFPSNRIDDLEVIKRMLEAFVKTHPEYTKEQIISAKDEYIDTQKKSNFTYVKKVSNFINNGLEANIRFLIVNERLEKNNGMLM